VLQRAAAIQSAHFARRAAGPVVADLTGTAARSEADSLFRRTAHVSVLACLTWLAAGALARHLSTWAAAAVAEAGVARMAQHLLVARHQALGAAQVVAGGQARLARIAAAPGAVSARDRATRCAGNVAGDNAGSRGQTAYNQYASQAHAIEKERRSAG